MSARREIDGLAVRTRIGQMLPAMFHDDDLAQRWCAGLDDVLAPVPATLDNFWAYLDPALAPVDFVEWLAGWVGLELDQTWTLERRRALVATAHRLHETRGTAGGLADLIELYTGVRPDVTESGGAAWSATPGAPLPGGGSAEVVVTLRLDGDAAVDNARLEHLVGFSKPAHVRHRIVVEGGGPPADPPAKSRAAKKATPPPPATAPAPPESGTPAPPPPPPPPPPPVAEDPPAAPAEGDDLESRGDDDAGS